MSESVLMTTFVFGETYQDYIPLFAKSINIAYPNYDIKVFVYGELKASVKAVIFDENINLAIVENAFREVKNVTPLIAKCLRWVLYEDSFLNYDAVYTLDIDMIYLNEDLPLHIQHLKHCDFIGLPFSNVLRSANWDLKSLRSLGLRLKRVGLNGLYHYIFQNREEIKATGLHFVKPKEYYSVITPDILKRLESDLSSRRLFRNISVPNNEVVLWKLLSDHFDLSTMCENSSDIELLDANGYNSACFRPHHGIHLGNFRIITKTNTVQQWQVDIFSSFQYRKYIDFMMRSDLISVFDRLSAKIGGNVLLQYNAFMEVCELQKNG